MDENQIDVILTKENNGSFLLDAAKAMYRTVALYMVFCSVAK
jgi:hypothetical protein